MVRQEETNQRDLTYSHFHRTLPDFCYMIDLDSIEWRAGRGVVALIETAKNVALVYRKKFQLKIIRELAQKIGAKGFLVLYNEELTMFEVYDLLSHEDWAKCDKQYMNKEDYITFIKNL